MQAHAMQCMLLPTSCKAGMSCDATVICEDGLEIECVESLLRRMLLPTSCKDRCRYVMRRYCNKGLHVRNMLSRLFLGYVVH